MTDSRAHPLAGIAELLEERAREFRDMHDKVPAFAGEIAVWSAAASHVRSLEGVLATMPDQTDYETYPTLEDYQLACDNFVARLRALVGAPTTEGSHD